MPKTHGSTDRFYVEHAAERGLTLTYGKLESWRREPPLLEPNPRSYPGGGGSSTPAPAEEIVDYVLWLAGNSRQGVSRHDLALRAFQEGHPVPERTVRAAFLAVVDDTFAEFDAIPGEGDPADRASDFVEARQGVGAHPAMLPARIRDLDRRLTEAGILEAIPELAAMDQGPAWGDEPPTVQTFEQFATSVALGGGAEADPAQLAAMARMMVPAGVANPVASWLTYDPGLVADADLGLIVPEAGNHQLLAPGPLSEQMRDLVRSTPLDLLRRSLDVAREQEEWAREAVRQVETAADSGKLDVEAVRAWVAGRVLFSHRMFLRNELGTKRRSWTDRPGSAINLLFVRGMLRGLFEAMPQGQWWLLDHPDIDMPPFFRAFLDIEPQQPPATEP